MLKKIFISLIFILFFSVSGTVMAIDAPKPKFAPLKLDYNYKYGTLEKTLNNQASSEFSDKQRENYSILDILNIIVFVIFLVLLCGFAYTKMRRINLEQLLKGNFHQLTESNDFKIISSKKLDDGNAVYLLEIGCKQIIVGTTKDSVKLLGQLDISQKQEEIPPEYVEKLFNGNTEEFKNLEE